MDAAKELGYRPNAIARSLVSKQTNLIGVIKGPNYNPMFSELLSALAMSIQKRGRQIVYYEIGNEFNVSNILRRMMQYRVDGLVLMYAHLSSELTQEAQKLGIPVLQMMRYSTDSHANVVLPNNHNGALLAAKHLIAQGYRSFAYISGEMGSSSNVERQLGFIHALSEYNQVPAVLQGDYTYDSGYNAFKKLAETAKLPCGILCANDVMALGVLDAAKDLKINVPQDIGVVGFDDIPMSKWGSYQLTTLRQPMEHIAESAIQLLLENIENHEKSPETLHYDFELIVRHSSSRTS